MLIYMGSSLTKNKEVLTENVLNVKIKRQFFTDY